MATLVLSSMIGAAGAQFFGPVGRFIGTEAGIFLGSQIDNMFLDRDDVQRTRYGPRTTQFNLRSNPQARMIPLIYGKVRVPGTTIWASPIKEVSSTEREIQNLSKSSPRIVTETTTFDYYATLAIAICTGPIDELLNIWIDDQLIDKNHLKYRLYKGTETQEPDYLIESIEGKVPAYLGLAYIVIEELQLKPYNNRVPSFSFEVQRILADQINHKIEGVVIIPGSGEFVYDTEINSKTEALRVGEMLLPIAKSSRINQNTNYDKADSLVALEQMESALPALRWVSVVINWFADSIRHWKHQHIPSCRV